MTSRAASATSMNLSWTLPAGTLSAISVERAATAQGPFAVIATLAGTAKTYIDTGLTVNLSYSYRVKATNSYGDSAYSVIVSATTSSYPPANPSGLVATAASQSLINLAWSDNSADETGFVIERGASLAGPFSPLITLGANVIVYADASLAASTTYYYRVAATNSSGKSGYTNTVSAMTSAAPPSATAPAAPAAASAAVLSGTQVKVSWTDSSSNETGFKIERATAAAGPFVLVTTVGSGVITYTDSGLMGVTTYYYRVSATNTVGNSAATLAPAVTTFGTFAWIKTNISTPRCVACHTGASAAAGYDLSTYAGTLGKVVINNSGASRFYLATLNGTMPPSGGALSTIQLNAIKTWIDSGALNN